MTQTQINCFITVARERNFTRAANALYISQPAISRSISKLEEELGFNLFERRDTALSLTVPGSQMYDFFVRTKSEFNALVSDIRSQLKSPKNQISIGCPETWNPSFFYSKIVSHFAGGHPDAKISIGSYRLADLITRIQSGKLDVGLSHDFYSPNISGLKAQLLTFSGCGVIYSKEHFGEVQSLESFRRTDFLLFDAEIEKKFSGIIKGLCGEYGFVPKIKNIGNMTSALFDVACGKGIMFFSDWDIAVANKAYGFLSLPVQMPVMLLHRDGEPGGLVQDFIDSLQAVFSHISAGS
jgi:DNA-binding transcriptional LysR family regulator